MTDEGARRGGVVAGRILARLQCLRRWLAEGVPDGATFVPRSLTQARLWDAPTLEIAPVPSPNAFTTAHPIHGDAIREMQGLIRALRERRSALAKAKPEPKPAAPVGRRASANDARLREVVSQWNAERARNRALLDENEHLRLRLERLDGGRR